MGIFDFMAKKGKELTADKDKVKEAVIEKELKDLGLTDGLGGDFRVEVKGDEVKLKGNVPDEERREKIILAAGNVNGIAKVNETLQAAIKAAKAKMAKPNFYEVKSGDTLSKISKAQYGDPMKYNAIFEANKPMLEHPDKIYPGQVLRIPDLDAKV